MAENFRLSFSAIQVGGALVSSSATGLGGGVEEKLSIVGVVGDGLTPGSAGHDGVEDVSVFNAGRPGHGGKVEAAGECVKHCCLIPYVAPGRNLVADGAESYYPDPGRRRCLGTFSSLPMSTLDLLSQESAERPAVRSRPTSLMRAAFVMGGLVSTLSPLGSALQAESRDGIIRGTYAHPKTFWETGARLDDYGVNAVFINGSSLDEWRWLSVRHIMGGRGTVAG